MHFYSSAASGKFSSSLKKLTQIFKENPIPELEFYVPSFSSLCWAWLRSCCRNYRVDLICLSVLNINSLLSWCWNPVIVFWSIPLNLLGNNTFIVVRGKKPLGKYVQQESWNIQSPAFVKIQMRHLKEWFEVHKPSQIIMALPGNLSKRKPLYFDSVFQGITIKTEFRAKIKKILPGFGFLFVSQLHQPHYF